MLAIDPSSGSQGSLPGFALFHAGVFKEAGTIGLPRGGDLKLRLRHLLLSLLHDFDEPDVLVLENLPAFMSSKGTSFRTQGVVNLHKSHGICMAAFETNKIIQVSPQSWHHYMKKLEGSQGQEYQKCDRNDAIALALTTYNEAKVEIPNLEEVIPYLFGGNTV
jgi:hypothetical protein